MSEMVERVALALHASFLKDWAEPDQTPWDELALRHREYGLKQARAAIEAMREPTHDMRMSFPPRLGDLTYRDTGDIWRRMIDAALVSREIS